MTNNQSTFTQEYGYLIDVFEELQDLRWSDLQYLEEYKELKMKKNDGLPVDQVRLDQLEEIFKNKIVTSSRWNKFQNSLVGMQTFIKENVEGYIEDKQQEFQAYIDRFSYRGTYSNTVQYYERNIVDFNDGSGIQSYMCIRDSLGNEPTNANYFIKLTIKGIRGEKGLDGVGLKFKGAWNSTTIYSKDDGVQYGGILFASLIDGNMDNTPDLTQNTPYWAKALDVTVTVRKMIGTRNITTQTSNVNFMTGEITSFNKDIDSLEVYQNSVRLTKGIDYNINSNNQSIDKVEDIWDASSEQPIFFEFVVTKNILNDLVFSDGSAIQDGTIAKSKLTTDIQETLDQIAIIEDEFGLLSTNVASVSSGLSDLEDEITTHKADLASQEVGKGASLIGLNDSANKFTATNVEGAMLELFTNVSSGKQLVGGAITDVDDSVVVPTDPTFQQLATAIGSIKTGRKWAEGNLILNNVTTFSISGLSFRPSLVVFYMNKTSTGSSTIDKLISSGGFFTTNPDFIYNNVSVLNTAYVYSFNGIAGGIINSTDTVVSDTGVSNIKFENFASHVVNIELHWIAFE